MSVIQAYPLKNLRMRGGLGPLQGEPATGVLTVTLEEINGGTRIRWEYVVGGYMRYDVETIAKAVDGVMSQQLAGAARSSRCFGGRGIGTGAGRGPRRGTQHRSADRCASKGGMTGVERNARAFR